MLPFARALESINQDERPVFFSMTASQVINTLPVLLMATRHPNTSDDANGVVYSFCENLSAATQQVIEEHKGEDDPAVNFYTRASRGYLFIAYIQLGIRFLPHPAAKAAAEMMIAAIVERHPEVEPFLNAGWNPDNDMTETELRVMEESGIPVVFWELLPPEG